MFHVFHLQLIMSFNAASWFFVYVFFNFSKYKFLIKYFKAFCPRETLFFAFDSFGSFPWIQLFPVFDLLVSTDIHLSTLLKIPWLGGAVSSWTFFGPVYMHVLHQEEPSALCTS